MKKTILSVIALGFAAASSQAQAAVLATPTFDTDSYIFVGNLSNNQSDPQITIGQSQQAAGQYHFNFAVIEFDVSSLNTAGDKFLRLSALDYVTGQPPALTHSSTGSATVQLVELDETFAQYLASGDPTGWYDTHVQNPSVTPVGTFSFTDLSTEYVDVTDTVNGWINDSTTNKGFALFANGGTGGIELGSMTYGTESLRPALVDAVPEPSSSAMLALGSLALLARRKKH